MTVYEGTTVLNYKLSKKLGEGGFGAVYLAEHAELGRRAAIKILHHQFIAQPQMVDRFFQEARAVCAINHRAIIAIENFGRLPTGEPFYLMEFFPGGSLGQVASERWLNSEQIIGILDPIAEALTAAHDKGIIHRDLKPDNVMVRIANDKVADVRLLDFGIAKLLDGQSHSMTGSSMGTPAFMPPEQAIDAKNVDLRADVYSFGATVYSAVAGRAPFDGSSVAAVLLMVQTDPAPLIQSIRPDVPPSLDAAIRRCLAKQREHRPATIAEAWQAIRAELVRAHLSSQPIPPNPEHAGVETPVPIEPGTPPPPVEVATRPARPTPLEVATKPARPAPRPAEEPATSPEVRATSKLPLILGGVGAVAVIGIVIAVASSGSKGTEGPGSGTGSGTAVAIAPPDAEQRRESPDAVTIADAEDRLSQAEVDAAFTKAANVRLLLCEPKPGAPTTLVTYRIDVGGDGTLGFVLIDGETTPSAECVRKRLDKHKLQIRNTANGGTFAVRVEMPKETKVAIKPPGPGSNPKPPDPKPGSTCDTLMYGALSAKGDAEVRAMLAKLEACRGKLDAAEFARIQQTLISK